MKSTTKENVSSKRGGPHYLTSTTLHGFKYLYSPHKLDRAVWVCCCLASAVCAGVLCTVLWTRFLQNPILMTVGISSRKSPTFMGICQKNVDTAQSMFQNMHINESYALMLAKAVSHSILKYTHDPEIMRVIDDLLSSRNLTLSSALMKYAPRCNQIIYRCRLRGIQKPCDTLFILKMTKFGACCCLNSSIDEDNDDEEKNPIMFDVAVSIVINCSVKSNMYKMFLDNEYMEEDSVFVLTPGFDYFSTIEINWFQRGNSESMFKSNCEHSPGYNRRNCLLKCSEHLCGCTDPLRDLTSETNIMLQQCNASRYPCLWKTISELPATGACKNCPLGCNRASVEVKLQNAPLNMISNSLDPFYSKINPKNSIALHTWISKRGSRVFAGISTDSWVTLLSSLGGIFNMFLGVGLFSIMELAYFILIRLLITMRTRTADDCPMHRQ